MCCAASPLPRCSSWCPPAVRQNVQQAARCSSPGSPPHPRASPDLRSPNIDAVHPSETTMIFV
ncbi:hypothetical protein Zm00014a_019637 [Zea mays]|uniref:Uncharacterized protein n=1 Tax=Zea mays TaxID=4577 RepID=A0A3L6EUZ8_MAIZE|nr:hypothetical protein Zm00014a_019637 [Zea mays]